MINPLKTLCIVVDSDDLVKDLDYSKLKDQYDFTYVYCSTPQKFQNEKFKEISVSSNNNESLDRIFMWAQSSEVDVYVLGQDSFKQEIVNKYTYHRSHIHQIETLKD